MKLSSRRQAFALVLVLMGTACSRAKEPAVIQMAVGGQTQFIYLPLRGSFVVPFLGHVTTYAGVASVGLRGIHAPLPKPSILLVPAMLRVWEIPLLLGSDCLRLMGACSVGV